MTKPVVGDRAFTREAGISIAGWSKYNIGSEPYLPELVGNKHGVVMGKKSGRHSIEWKLNQLGLSVPAELIPEILDEVKNISVSKKSAIEDEEFITIVNEVLSKVGKK